MTESHCKTSVYMDSENRAIVYFDKYDLHVFGAI